MMAVKHFCDRCGKETVANELKILRIPVEAAGNGFVVVVKELCASCYDFVKNEAREYDIVKQKEKIAFYAYLMAYDEREGDKHEQIGSNQTTGTHQSGLSNRI